MDFVFWIIAIVLIVGVVWWLLNRNSSTNADGTAPLRKDGAMAGGSAAASAEAAGTAGLPSAAGFGSAAEPTPPTTADDTQPETAAGQSAVTGQEAPREPAAAAPKEPTAVEEPLAAGHAGVPAEPAAARATAHSRDVAGEDAGREDAGITEGSGDTGGTGGTAARQAEDEWETQWSEASGSTPAAGHRVASDAPTGTATGVVHHPEYTGPHAPTLPGAETAAADALTADDMTADAGETARETPAAGDGAPVEPTAAAAGYEPAVEPIGHLAAGQPYGAGSASPGPDGSGPADFDVKGDASAMVYYEERHPEYEQTTADVWFESAAHAEAAGFRAPRRTRL